MILHKPILSNFAIYQVEKKDLKDIVRFSISANYDHYKDSVEKESFGQDIKYALSKEISYFKNAVYYAILHKSQVVGTIRTMVWDRKATLPINEIFGFSLNAIRKFGIDSNTTYWHVGRFAIDNTISTSLNIRLFKMLMVYAIQPICKQKNSVMIAECDSRLLAVMNKLGIEAKAIGPSVNYLGSETIPVVATRENLLSYYERNKQLLLM